MRHDRDAIGHRERFFLIVRDVQERRAELFVQRLELELHLLAELEVDRTERLIEQQDGGVEDEGAGQGDALALSAGELRRRPARERLGCEANEVKRAGDTARDLRAGRAALLESERDVALD